ncbi:hypothetical protein C0Q70_11790 [Pomacea canaliculata]|uniref:Uncharacterized protein n=1 Tax=Pomacea canaliculata TaxID=400727 RepID=A0A2T7P723_POMCA|nr:hypothetical protein C0Q70_11790 [Pomacea canaliculata]
METRVALTCVLGGQVDTRGIAVTVVALRAEVSACNNGCRDWVTESLYTTPDLQEGTTKDPASSRVTEGQRSLTVTDRAALSLDLEALAGRTVEGGQVLMTGLCQHADAVLKRTQGAKGRQSLPPPTTQECSVLAPGGKSCTADSPGCKRSATLKFQTGQFCDSGYRVDYRRTSQWMEGGRGVENSRQQYVTTTSRTGQGRTGQDKTGQGRALRYSAL